MKYSKRVREEAAMLCAIAANSRWTGSHSSDWLTTWAAGRLLDVGEKTKELADLAWYSVNTFKHSQEMYAEAEARLRTGWSPGGKP